MSSSCSSFFECGKCVDFLLVNLEVQNHVGNLVFNSNIIPISVLGYDAFKFVLQPNVRVYFFMKKMLWAEMGLFALASPHFSKKMGL